MTALAAVALLAWAYMALLHGRFWSTAPRLAPTRPIVAPAVDVIVPARNEAAFVRASVASLLAQDYAGAVRVTVVDDDSDDGTGAIVHALSGAVVLRGAPRPPGWAGKLWAVSQGVASSEAPWLFLTDADIVHDPRHLATLMAHAEACGLDMVSEMVTLRCIAWPERLLIPAFVYFFALLFPFRRVNAGRIAAAAGGTVLIRRAVLARAGGIAAIRARLIDDVALAGAVRAAGGRIWLGHSRLARSVRPYPAFADIWAMVARSAYVQLRCSPSLLAGSILGMALLFLAPVAALAGAGWPLGLGAWLLMAATFLPAQRLLRPRDAWLIAFVPLMALFYMAATLGSAITHHRGRGVAWKARAYAGSRP